MDETHVQSLRFKLRFIASIHLLKSPQKDFKSKTWEAFGQIFSLPRFSVLANLFGRLLLGLPVVAANDICCTVP